MKAINYFFRLQMIVLYFGSSVSFGCASALKNTLSNQEYSDAWWAPVPPEDIKPWEIPPQAADRNQNLVVLSKRTELAAFSNLAESPFQMDSVQFKSIEGLWQGMKYPEDANDERFSDKTIVWPFTREQVYQMSGFEAKKAGDMANENMKKLGIKWVTYKGKKLDYKGSDQLPHYEIVYQASVAKIEQNPLIKQLLLKTKGLVFMLDHKQEPNSPPAYRTDLIYMKLRDQ